MVAQTWVVPAGYHVVQFCPCGCVQNMSEEEVVRLGGQRQLNRIAAGEKLDAPIFSTKDCPSCNDEAEERNRRGAEIEADWPEPN